MTNTHVDNLSDLLELGEKTLNEGDYLKLATFLKGLKDSAKPAPTRITTRNMEITLEFDTMGGHQMRICIDSVRTIIYPGATPNQEIILGSINGTPLEIEERPFVEKVELIYRLYGMKNIKRSTSMCEPHTFENVGKFKEWHNDHNKAHFLCFPEGDHDPENWTYYWLFTNLCGLNNCD